MSYKSIIIDGVEFVPKEQIEKKSQDYKMVRTYSAGVFFGIIESRNGQEIVMRNARRVWYWKGAASLSQLSVDGTSDPSSCKFPVAVDRVELLQVIEILDITDKALKSLSMVPVWNQ